MFGRGLSIDSSAETDAFYPGWNQSAGNGTAPFFAMDANGDGKTDYVSRSSNGVFTTRLSTAPLPDLLTTVTNGLGATTTVTYKPLTDASVYQKGSCALYPYADLQIPLYVAATVSSSDGIGGQRSTSNTYSGLLAHLEGGGLMGFRQVAGSDSVTGISTYTSYSQDYPYHGLPLVSEQYAPGGILVSHAENQWSHYVNPAWGPAYHFPYVAFKLEDSYELDGGLIARIGTDTRYDNHETTGPVTATAKDHGNVTRITITSHDDHLKDTANSYADITGANRWFLGRLARSTVTASKAAGNGSLLRGYPTTNIAPVCNGDNLAGLGTVFNPGPDSDGDGLPDSWELQYGLNPGSASDGTQDKDGDGLTNAQEFTAGSNPTLADSDGDGIGDKAEVDQGRNPTVNEAALQVIIDFLLSD